MCEKLVTGTPKEPATDDTGKATCVFYDSWNSVELKLLDDICQLCYSERICAKFKDTSGGEVDIVPYHALRQAVYEHESSDDDSFITSHSLDDSSDGDPS